MGRFICTILLLLVGGATCALGADEFEQPPIEYSRSTPANPVANLQAALDRAEITLRHDAQFGYLPDLLQQLGISGSSQMLVFSKTSLQRDRIAPRTPRALYFNDEVYVGFCHAGEMLEISTADPQLGTVFYTLDQKISDRPRITRQGDNCLQCHGTFQTNNIPGHTIRSLFVDPAGLPLLSEGSKRVDHTTPFENRWGGWYVTGTHGAQQHQGNLIITDREAPRPWLNPDGQNVTDLSQRFPTGQYLTPHSDIVALLVFEHQTYLHNLLTKASFTARQALHYEAGINKALGEPAGRRLDSTTRRIDSASEKLVQGLLFSREAPLRGQITGTSGYAQQFSQVGKRDQRGRSLRDFDLTTRLFKYPCSYLIDSPEFAALPPLMKTAVLGKLRAALEGHGGENYQHLTAEDRQAILEILAETKPDLWQVSEAKPGA